MNYRIDDEGGYFELIIQKGGRQFCSFLIDIEPLGEDRVLEIATQVQALVFNALGDGGGSAP